MNENVECGGRRKMAWNGWNGALSRIVRAPMFRALAPVDIQLLHFLFA